MRLILSIIILWFLPGFAFLTALFTNRKQFTFWQKIVFAVPSSVIISSLAGLVLARFYLLEPQFILISVVLISVFLFVLAFMLGYKLAILKVNLLKKDLIKEWPLISISFFGCFLLLLGVICHPLPIGPATTYIYNAVQIAQNHGIPDYFREWNGLQHVPINKILFEIFIAEFYLLSGINPLFLARVCVFLSSSATICTAGLFLRLFFSSFVSSVILSLLFFIPALGLSLINKINRFAGEAFSYPAMFFLFWLSFCGFYLNENKKKWLAVIFLPLVNSLHGIPGLISALFSMSVLSACALLKRYSFKKAIFYFMLIIVVFLSSTKLTSYATGRDFVYDDVMKGAKYHTVNGEDPTWLFLKIVTGRNEAINIQPHGFYKGLNSSLSLVNKYISFLPISGVKLLYSGVNKFKLQKMISSVNIRSPFSKPQQKGILFLFGIARRWFLAIAEALIFNFYINLIILFFIFGFVYLRLSTSSNIVSFSLLSWFIFDLAILFFAFSFLWIYSTYIPAIHFFRRELRFIGFLPLFIWGFLFTWFESARNKLFKSWKQFFCFSKAAFIILIIILSALSNYLWYIEKGNGLTADSVAAFEWLKNRVPESKSVLTNQWTHCSIGLIANASGVLDGRAPYLEPYLLYNALDKLISAKSFFTEGKNSDILKNENVAFVVAAPRSVLGGQDITLGKYSLKTLFSSPLLKPVKRFGKVFIFEVLNHAQ